MTINVYNQNPTPAGRFVSRLTRDAMALVLAGGRGSRLENLTDWRAKPAVPFGGKFRIVDFPLSNCLNSGIRRVGVLTQYKAHSLIRHIQRGWGMIGGDFGPFVELLPAQQRTDENSWYKGTADAVFQNIDIIRSFGPRYVIVLAGDHVYKMDYGPMLAYHVAQQSDLTIGCIEVPVDDARAFGVLSMEADGRVNEFNEKPEDPAELADKPGTSLASMGIYIFDMEFLVRELITDHKDESSSHDFGKDIIPRVIRSASVYGYSFLDKQSGGQSYWRDVGTVDTFWGANLELTRVLPELNLYDKEWPIWTHQEQAPPAKFVHNTDEKQGAAYDSLVAGGCIISGATLTESLLFSNVSVAEFSHVERSVIMPEVTVGRNCVVRNAVVDKGCVIADGTQIGVDLDRDREKYHVSPGGIVLVTPDMLDQNLHSVV
jgi:glucose-1-phosphate adenylyltransferase